jgi:hypothetical protein
VRAAPDLRLFVDLRTGGRDALGGVAAAVITVTVLKDQPAAAPAGEPAEHPVAV